ncbi:MAG: hypothetical protein KGZ83_01730 [Sulfuricella sp.]|nr:hypothetical protein [Sulfuricella sp.]
MRASRSTTYPQAWQAALGAGLLAALLPALASACSSGMCLLNSDWESQGLFAKPGLRLDFRYDYLDQNQLRQGTGNAGSFTFPGEREIEHDTTTHHYTLGLDYSPNRVWGINVQLPYLDRAHDTVAAQDSELSASHTRTLGDARILGRYQGFSPEMDSGAVFGVKLPSGPYRANFNSGPQAGNALDRSLQPGTGSTDLIVGVYHFGNLNHDWGWFGQALYQQAVNTQEDYRPGKSLNLNLGTRYYLSQSVSPQLQLNGQLRDRDRGANGDPDNTGGKLIYLSPGITVNVDRNWKVYSFLQVPLYQQVNGLQLAARWNFSVGMNWGF